jgi:hypothetical protein
VPREIFRTLNLLTRKMKVLGLNPKPSQPILVLSKVTLPVRGRVLERDVLVLEVNVKSICNDFIWRQTYSACCSRIVDIEDITVSQPTRNNADKPARTRTSRCRLYFMV